MKVTLGTNIAALTAQGQLGSLEKRLSTVFERLSTGVRINGPADDPAGLATAERLALDSEIFTQGIRNLNEGISLLATADSAIELLNAIVYRIEEMAEQSANDVMQYGQRVALDGEAQELSREFTRIVQSAEYNGIKLFDGSLGSGVSLQAGYGANGEIAGGIGGYVGTGDFETATTYATAGAQTVRIVTGDFNGDGIIDMATGDGAPANTVSVFLGQGDGSFGAATGYVVPSHAEVIRSGDFNGDGVLDLAASSYTFNTTTILMGQGDGTFSLAGSVSQIAHSDDFIVADMNNDGNDDLIHSVDHGSIDLEVRLGNGDGTFDSALNYSGLPSSPHYITSGDVDGDGLLDIVASVWATGELYVLHGNGNGSFTSTDNYAVQGLMPVLGDLNGDEVLDITMTNSVTNELYVMLGNEDGTFGSATSYTVNNSPFHQTLGDFNGDGEIDVAVSNYVGNTVSVLYGTGGGSLSAATIFAAGVAGVRGIDSNDLNDDGVLDIVFASTTGAAGVLLGETEDGISSLLSFSLLNEVSARQALAPLKNKRALLNQTRASIVAYQSRVELTMSALSGSLVATHEAESRIRDADIAAEASELARLQILQQAATAMLAQANSTQSSVVLQLLNQE